MTFKKSLTPLAIAVSVASASAVVIPSVASAGTSASVAVSNFYLWRGTNISEDDPAVSGSLDYSHASGLYAGIWVSNEGQTSQSSETDLYVGFAGEAGSVSYDVSLISYEYSDATGSEHYGDFSELIAGIGVGGASFTIYQSLQGDNSAANTGGAYTYYTLGYSINEFGITYGGWSGDRVTEYAHLDLSYSPNDEITFTISSVVDDDDKENLETDALFNVIWTKSFDI